MSSNKSSETWLDKADAGDRIFKWLIIAAVVAALPDIFSLIGILYETHPYTTVEEIPVFYGLYTAICFLALIVVAKTLQSFVKREEDYYD